MTEEKEVMKFSIPIIPRTKKNSSEIRRRRGKPYIAPSHLYENYEYEGIMSIPNKYKKKIDYPVNIKATYYVKRNARIDKTNLESALMDMLVAAGVLADDSALKPSIVVATDGSRVYYDKNNPHIEVEITRMEECYYGN